MMIFLAGRGRGSFLFEVQIEISMVATSFRQTLLQTQFCGCHVFQADPALDPALWSPHLSGRPPFRPRSVFARSLRQTLFQTHICGRHIFQAHSASDPVLCLPPLSDRLCYRRRFVFATSLRFCFRPSSIQFLQRWRELNVKLILHIHLGSRLRRRES
jgi:hypothetical protein